MRLEPYKDSEGYWTIGIGHMIDRRLGGSLPSWIRASFPLDRAEVHQLLMLDIGQAEAAIINRKPWVVRLDPVRRTIMVALCFQLGINRLLLFHNTLAAIQAGDWDAAANGLINSKMHSQATARTNRLAAAMRTGNEADLGL